MAEGLSEFHPDTQIVATGRPERTADSPVGPKISLTSTHNAISDQVGGIGYARFGNETWSDLESAIGALEKGKTLIFASGMAAISAAFSLLKPGSTIVASKNGYSGLMNLLNGFVESQLHEVRFINIADNAEVAAAAKGADLLWVESPTNPAMEVADLAFIAKAAHENKAKFFMDNTFATPLRQQPLTLGAELVMNSVTKFISGHSDLLMGALSTNDEAIFSQLQQHRTLGGAIPGPMEAWLALRGMRTMAIRLERAEENAMELARRLSQDPMVTRVRYPGLPTDPFHQIAKAQMSGFGAVLAFEVAAQGALSAGQVAQKVCESSRLIHHATSLGGVETLWERRRRWSSESPTIPEGLIRIAVGIENIEDLWSDIKASLTEARSANN
jgi:cystathionine gamma-synthase